MLLWLCLSAVNELFFSAEDLYVDKNQAGYNDNVKPPIMTDSTNM
jgi:hypothetical protein